MNVVFVRLVTGDCQQAAHKPRYFYDTELIENIQYSSATLCLSHHFEDFNRKINAIIFVSVLDRIA